MNIIQEPSKKLTQITETVDEAYVNSVECKVLLRKMYSTMLKSKGIGIAAPQVGVNKRMAMIRSDLVPLNIHYLYILLNPFYTTNYDSLEKLKVREGCLSIDKGTKLLEVYRYKTIKVCTDVLQPNGTLYSITQEVSGLLSIIIQHEVDHLNGILINHDLLLEGK